MKKVIPLAFLALMGSVAFFGCSKSTTKAPTNGTGTTGSPYKMNAVIGGVPFSRDSCVFHANIVDSTDVEILGWAGYPTSGPNYYPQIYLFFPYSYHGIGTYPFTGNTHAQLLKSSTSGEFSSSGSITITATYPSVAGTFSFTTVSGVVVSNGSFTALRD